MGHGMCGFKIFIKWLRRMDKDYKMIKMQIIFLYLVYFIYDEIQFIESHEFEESSSSS